MNEDINRIIQKNKLKREKYVDVCLYKLWLIVYNGREYEERRLLWTKEDAVLTAPEIPGEPEAVKILHIPGAQEVLKASGSAENQVLPKAPETPDIPV